MCPMNLLVILFTVITSTYGRIITENTVEYNRLSVSIGEIKVNRGAYWSIVDNTIHAFAGTLENHGGLYITSSSKILGLQVEMASGIGSLINYGIMSINSLASKLVPSHINLSGLRFENQGRLYLGSASNILKKSHVSITAPSWNNNGTIVLYQEKKYSGRVKFGALLPITNTGSICIYNHDFIQTTKINGNGCITASRNGRIELIGKLHAADQTFILDDSESVLSVHAFIRGSIYKVSGFGNRNKISLESPLVGIPIFGPPAFSYDPKSGILTLRTAILSQKFNIGRGYNPDLFHITDDSEFGIDALLGNAITYFGPIPKKSNGRGSCAPCMYKFPVAPGSVATKQTMQIPIIIDDVQVEVAADVLVTTSEEGQWYTTTVVHPYSSANGHATDTPADVTAASAQAQAQTQAQVNGEPFKDTEPGNLLNESPNQIEQESQRVPDVDNLFSASVETSNNESNQILESSNNPDESHEHENHEYAEPVWSEHLSFEIPHESEWNEETETYSHDVEELHTEEPEDHTEEETEIHTEEETEIHTEEETEIHTEEETEIHTEEETEIHTEEENQSSTEIKFAAAQIPNFESTYYGNTTTQLSQIQITEVAIDMASTHDDQGAVATSASDVNVEVPDSQSKSASLTHEIITSSTTQPESFSTDSYSTRVARDVSQYIEKLEVPSIVSNVYDYGHATSKWNEMEINSHFDFASSSKVLEESSSSMSIYKPKHSKSLMGEAIYETNKPIHSNNIENIIGQSDKTSTDIVTLTEDFLEQNASPVASSKYESGLSAPFKDGYSSDGKVVQESTKILVHSLASSSNSAASSSTNVINIDGISNSTLTDKDSMAESEPELSSISNLNLIPPENINPSESIYPSESLEQLESIDPLKNIDSSEEENTELVTSAEEISLSDKIGASGSIQSTNSSSLNYTIGINKPFANSEVVQSIELHSTDIFESATKSTTFVLSASVSEFVSLSNNKSNVATKSTGIYQSGSISASVVTKNPVILEEDQKPRSSDAVLKSHSGTQSESVTAVEKDINHGINTLKAVSTTYNIPEASVSVHSVVEMNPSDSSTAYVNNCPECKHISVFSVLLASYLLLA